MSGVVWSDAEREAVAGHGVVAGSGYWPWRCECGEEYRTSVGHDHHVREAVLDALARFVAAREAQAAAKALADREAVARTAATLAQADPNLTPQSALNLLHRAVQGSALEQVRKVLFEDATLNHDDRLRKIAALLDAIERGES